MKSRSPICRFVNPAATNIATSVRCVALPWTTTSVAERIATPRALPHWRVAVSNALAVPSEFAARRMRSPPFFANKT